MTPSQRFVVNLLLETAKAVECTCAVCHTPCKSRTTMWECRRMPVIRQWIQEHRVMVTNEAEAMREVWHELRRLGRLVCKH